MARREKEVEGGLVRKDKRNGKKNSDGGGAENKGKKPRSGAAKAGRRKVYQNRGESPKQKNAQPATVEVKRYIEGGVHALLSLPKDTREVYCYVPDRNGNKAEFSAIGGGFNTGKLDEAGQPVIVEFVEIRLVSTEVGNSLHALPESAKGIFITPTQVTVSPEKFVRKSNWTDAVYEVRLALREYLRDAMTYSSPAPIYVSQLVRNEREVPAILKPMRVVEPKLVPESQMAKLEAMKHQLSEAALRAGAKMDVSAFMRAELGKYRFGDVYIELKQAGKDVRVNLLCVEEDTPLFEKLGHYRNIGFSFAQLEGSAVLPLVLREGQEPVQVAVRYFLKSLREFLARFGFKVHEVAEEPKANWNEKGCSNELRAISVDEVRRDEVGTFDFEGVSLKTKKVHGINGSVAAVFVTAVSEDHHDFEDLNRLIGKRMFIPVYLAEKFKQYPREKMTKMAKEDLDALEALFELMRRAFGLEVRQPKARNLLAEVVNTGEEHRARAPQFGR